MINKFLKESRIKSGLTQKLVAEALGYSSAQYISNIERGLCGPPLAKLRDYCKLLDVDLEQCKKLMAEDYFKTMARI